MKKIIKYINKWLIDITNLLTNVFVFAVICGLLFNDPFGVINTISTLISNVGERGLAGFISLAIIILKVKDECGVINVGGKNQTKNWTEVIPRVPRWNVGVVKFGESFIQILISSLTRIPTRG